MWSEFEYICSLIIVICNLCCIYDPLIWRIVSIPLLAYNFSRYKAGDHKIYFITLKEYKDNDRIKLQYQLKTPVYAVLFVISLVMGVFKLIEVFNLK